jgi:hypothetical protein
MAVTVLYRHSLSHSSTEGIRTAAGRQRWQASLHVLRGGGSRHEELGETKQSNSPIAAALDETKLAF